MDIYHPWTKYEIARLRDEERLLRARSAMRALELREEPAADFGVTSPRRATSWLDRLRHRDVTRERAAAGSRAG